MDLRQSLGEVAESIRVEREGRSVVDMEDHEHCNNALRSLSKKGASALRDFAYHLSILGKESLDEEAFNAILDSVGYQASKEGLFDCLLDEVAAAARPDERDEIVTRRLISYDNMATLYASDPYYILDRRSKDSRGDKLMSYIDDIFDGIDAKGDGCLTKGDISILLNKIMDGMATDDHIDTLFEFLCKDDDTIDRRKFKSSLLKPNHNKSLTIPATVNYNIFNPALVSNTDFVSELEKYSLSHAAVKHHLLQNIAEVAFGKDRTLAIITRFFIAYSYFNSGFISNVKRLLNMLDTDSHREVLEENLIEEMGIYDDETLCELEDMGISRESVENIPHSTLFQQMVTLIEQRCGERSYRDDIPRDVASIQRDAMNKARETKIGLIGGLYFGSELIVPQLYGQLLQGLRSSADFSDQDLCFLILHIDMDDDHAEKLREIVIDHCSTSEQRLQMFESVDNILNARVQFYEALIGLCDLQSEHANSCGHTLEAQSTRFNDSSCRQALFDLCGEVSGSTIIDIGCGEGHICRKLSAMGADKLIGIDTRQSKIDLAKNDNGSSSTEHYIVGNAANLREVLLDHSSETNLMVGEQFDVGMFDLGVAFQLFNVTTIEAMNKVLAEVYTILKPGGHFIFRVHHPSSHPNQEGYFSLKDTKVERNDDCPFLFKTITDYVDAIKARGFSLVDLMETRPSRDSNDVEDRPLSLIIKIQKPLSASGIMSNDTSVDVLMKKLIWNRVVKKNFKSGIEKVFCESCNDEVCRAAISCYERGFTAEDIEIGRDVDVSALSSLKLFCQDIRTSLLHQTGAVFVKGLDMKRLGGNENTEKMTACSKIAYFLISSLIGTVDGTARGKLFDVKSRNISEKTDNVLFSVTNNEAGWHTDGASKDRNYDAVGLMCISPAAKGGKFRLSNACNAYDDLCQVLPKFLMYELTRPLPRDILENGNGTGSKSLESTFSRFNDVLALRIRYNSYPIYVTEGDNMRFRYMRYWIETAHKKTGWKVPTLLRVAMDMLDTALNNSCVFYESLCQGDIVYANNAIVAHARDGFENNPDCPRHKVRVWLQMQKVDALKA